jgi:hypothetical protein
MRRSTAWLVSTIVSGLLFLAVKVVAHTPAMDRLAEFGKRCGLSATSKPRLFAAPDGRHWKEYPRSRNIPEPNPDWSVAAFFARDDNASAAEIDGVGQDFSDSTLYCFDRNASLALVEREFLTAWGWGYSETDLFHGAVVSEHKEHYFDTKTRQVISRPAGSHDVQDAMKLTVYRSLKDLPFSGLM